MSPMIQLDTSFAAAPSSIQARYKEQFGLPEYDINIITEDKTLTDLFESFLQGLQG